MNTGATLRLTLSIPKQFLCAVVAVSFCAGYCTPAFSQEWVYKTTIRVGPSPDVAILNPANHELYVANKAGTNISVIDTLRNVSLAPFELAGAPKTIALSKDGERLYVLVNEGRSDSCGNGTNRNWLVTIDIPTRAIGSPVPLSGPRWDDLAVSADGRLFLTGTCEAGVYVFDTVNGVLDPTPAIHDRGCPTGIALSQSRIYVDYQCFGPEGSPGHDSIAIYDLSPPYVRIRVIGGFPNVGGQLALSPDQSQLWAGGNDACAQLQPTYAVGDCKSVPSAIVNVIGTSDLRRITSYEFSTEDSNGRISFSPDGVAFIGLGIYLKEVPTDRVVSVEDVRRLPIASVGSVAFSQDGHTAYVVATDKGVVYVMTRASPGAHVSYREVQGLTASMAFAALGGQGTYGACVAKPDNTRNCFRVPPEALGPVLWQRADDAPLRACGSPFASGQAPNKAAPPRSAARSPSDIYRCAANAALELALAGKLNRADGIAAALDLMDLETNEDNMEWRVLFEEYKQLSQEDPSNLTPRQRKRLQELSPTYKDAEGRDSRTFTDITLRVHDQGRLSMSLGPSAAWVSISSWGRHTYTLVTSQSEQTVQEDFYQGQPLDQKTLDQLASKYVASASDINREIPFPSEGRALYESLIGGEVSQRLKSLESSNTGQKPTLVWTVEGSLRTVPMGALWYEDSGAKHYLVENFSSVLLTTLRAASTLHRDQTWRALAFGASGVPPDSSLEPLAHVSTALRNLFPPVGAPIAGIVLRDDSFTRDTLSSQLQAVRGTSGGSNRVMVFFATHFVLDPRGREQTSYLVTGDRRKLTMRELSDAEAYPFSGVDLVVFGTCQSGGFAESPSGGELPSLAFHLDQRGNGAKAVLAPLWTITPDDTLDKFFWTFFKNLRNGQMTTAEALRDAQAGMIGEGLYRWAPFVLMGEWR